jgi:hypothetical protein
MLRQALSVMIVLVCLNSSQPAAWAKPTQVQVNGREFVVHNSSVPVLVHRALPPYWGKHVTQRQLKAGRLPPGAKR